MPYKKLLILLFYYPNYDSYLHVSFLKVILQLYYGRDSAMTLLLILLTPLPLRSKASSLLFKISTAFFKTVERHYHLLGFLSCNTALLRSLQSRRLFVGSMTNCKQKYHIFLLLSVMNNIKYGMRYSIALT
jgi:hypothetical protein